MRFSIKLILLVTALCAVVVAWIGVRQQMIVAETQLLANTGWNEGSIEVAESSGGRSYFTSDAAGTFHIAHVDGFQGLEVLNEERADFRITSLTVHSTEAFLALEPRVLPKLERLCLTDIDFSQVTLEKIASFPRLKELSINGHVHDPFVALATLPSLQNRVLLLLDLPTEADPRLPELKERMPAYIFTVKQR